MGKKIDANGEPHRGPDKRERYGEPEGGGKGSRGTIFDTILVLVRVLYFPNGDCGWMPQEEALSQIPGLFPRRGG